MKLRYIVAVALLIPINVSAQGVADAFIQGMEAGRRARLQREQMEREAEAHRMRMQLMETQLEMLRQEVRQREQAARDAQALKQKVDSTANTEITAFTARFPDWPQYEAQMLEHAKLVQPDSLSTQDYLELLYLLAISDRQKPATTARGYTWPIFRAPQSGHTYDWRSGSSYSWQRNGNGDTYVNGMNLNSGSMWNTTIKPDGSMSGFDQNVNWWQYNAQSGVYMNLGTGRMCVGTGLLRTCF